MENEYRPDVVTPPGVTLQEIMAHIGMSQTDLATRTGRPIKTINEIIQGKTAITPETALQLERVLGTPARFWNDRERHYREFLARQEESGRLGEELAWLQEIPVRAMVKLGWVGGFKDQVPQLRECLNFFGVASPAEWRKVWMEPQASYRKSQAFCSEPGAVAAWLRRGEVEGQHVECASFDATVFRDALSEIRPLTRGLPKVFQPELVRLCSAAGVAVAFIPEIPKARVSGATRWMTKDKALIQLSLRYKSDDQLWFTFFHEAGHILKHGRKSIFIEGNGTRGEEEREADEFASGTLIPPSDFTDIAFLPRLSKKDVTEFAGRIGIAPGIVVGRLQHDKTIPQSHMNGLKRRLEWA